MQDSQNYHPNLATALDLAKAGLYVFPCQASGPSIKSPHKGIYWRNVSTNDPDKVVKLWAKHPDAVPAIDLAKSNLLVIDCDKKINDGLAWFTSLALTHNDDLTTTPAVQTPSKGRHHFYKNTFNPPHGNGRGHLPPKTEADVDVRGAGGFVIAPGSQSEQGTYTLYGSLLDAPEPPPWLASLLEPRPAPQPALAPFTPVSDARKEAYGAAALQGMVEELTNSPSGTRSDVAFKIAARAGELVGSDCIAYREAYTQLAEAAKTWGVSQHDKVFGPHGTLARGLAAGMKNPKGPQDHTTEAVELLLPELQTSQLTVHGPQALELPPSQEQAPTQKELPPHLLKVPGLVGEITQWITDTALYPQPGLALGAALVIVGTAAGRHIAGPTRSGTHLYVVGIARSAAGKDHPLKQIKNILDAAGLQEHTGPSQFISMPALVHFMERKPLAVCCMDEMGAFLKRINNKRASGFEGAISSVFRSVWGSSFDPYATPEWAQLESKTIYSPALSIYGISTVAEFYNSLEDADIVNGLLNRFLMIETRHRPAEQHNTPDKLKVPPTIISQLAQIYGQGGILGQLCQSTMRPAFKVLKISPEAEKIRRDMVEDMKGRGDKNAEVEPFVGRTAEMAIRLATIVTVGLNSEQIELSTMIWARDFALWSMESLVESAAMYIANSETQAMANEVRRTIQRLSNGKGRVKRSAVIQALKFKFKSRDLKDVLDQMAESEDLKVEKSTPPGGGTPTFWYTLTRTV